MKTISIDLGKTPAVLRKGLRSLQKILPLRFTGTPSGYSLSFQEGESGPRIGVEDQTITVRYREPCQAFRGLGIVSGFLRQGKPPGPLSEKHLIPSLWIMLDVSRNAAPLPVKLKEHFLRYSLMGINGFMLYAETNYEIPGEPYWGYNTGRYSIREQKDLSDFADALGIEMIPCIQVLAHLRRALHWEVYRGIRDTDTVMLVDEPASYRLIEKMIQSAAKPYKSKQIHVGMDEAWDLGLGNYLKERGYQKPYDLMTRHLAKVMGIIRKAGLQPMIWADMFFRASSKTGAYYDEDVEFTKKLKDAVPKDVSLVYWNYHHTRKSHYLEWIDRHLELADRKRIVMSPSVHTPQRFWSFYPCVFVTLDASMQACKEKGIERLLVTAWGDDGNECHLDSLLPSVQYFAEHGYNRRVDRKRFEENLLGSCGIRFSDWEPAGGMNNPPGLSKTHIQNNVSKALLWEDPLFGPVQPMVKDFDLKSHYLSTVGKLEKAVARGNGLQKALRIPCQLAKILTVKCDFPGRLYACYNRGDKKAMKHLLDSDIPFLKKEVRNLWKLHRRYWYDTNQVYGWETLESRYGGLILRLESTAARIADYLDGRTEKIEELEGKRLPMIKLPKGRIPQLRHAVCCTATPNAVN